MSISKILYSCIIMSLFILVFSVCGCPSNTDKTEEIQDSIQQDSITDTEKTETVQDNSSQEQGKDIPHTLSGRRDTCLGCHNASTILPIPSDHQGRTNDECTECHKVVSNPSSETAIAIPHSLENRLDCFECHAEGPAPVIPANHIGRTSDVCTACHRQ